MLTYNRENGGAAALARMASHLGLPYIFGLHDCSWLAEDGYEFIGVQITRTTYTQYLIARIFGAWMAGDLAFVRGSDPGPQGEPGHVGAFVGVGSISSVNGGEQNHFTPHASGRLVFINEPFTGTVCRYDYFEVSGIISHTRPAELLPNAPAPKPLPAPSKKRPSAAVLKQCKLDLLSNVGQATEAKSHHWTLWYWGIDGHFHPQVSGLPMGVPLYATLDWAKNNVASPVR